MFSSFCHQKLCVFPGGFRCLQYTASFKPVIKSHHFVVLSQGFQHFVGTFPARFKIGSSKVVNSRSVSKFWNRQQTVVTFGPLWRRVITFYSCHQTVITFDPLWRSTLFIIVSKRSSLLTLYEGVSAKGVHIPFLLKDLNF